MPNFQAGAGPARTPKEEDRAQEHDDMADVMDFFLVKSLGEDHLKL